MWEQFLAGLQSTGVFIIVLSVLIVVHEWGHFITAKRLGVKIESFALGFGPKIFSKIHNGTDYRINLIPLGGYVKMAGDVKEEWKGRPEEFFSKPVGHRSLIVLNGPVVNFVLAYFCLAFVFMMGYPDLSTNIGKLIDDYPAMQAGLKEGDQITHIDGKEVESWTALQNAIGASDKENIEVKILRYGEALTLNIYPKLDKVKNIFGQEKVRRLIGIQPAEDVIALRYPPGKSFIKAFEKLMEITVLTYKSLYFMLTGSMSAKENVTGPIGIFYIIKAAAEMGFAHVLFIMGVISASLAIFNLLPIIPLDGGHLFLLAIEKIRGRALSPKVDEVISKIGFSLIILLALFVFYSDFDRFGWIEKIKKLFS